MTQFKVGDKVRWIRAAQWNLKDQVGTIIGEVQSSSKINPPPVEYQVEFRFGRITLQENQMANFVEIVEKINKPQGGRSSLPL